MRIRVTKPFTMSLEQGVELELDKHVLLAILEAGHDVSIEAADRLQDARELESLIEEVETRHLRRIERIRNGWRS